MTRCPRCGARGPCTHALPRVGDGPHGMVPFALAPDQARTAAARWLRRSWAHPWDLARVPDRLERAWVPFWVVRATVDAEWRALVGIDHAERTYDGSGRGGWEVVSRVAWRWQTGRVRLPDRACFVPATTRYPAPLLEAVGARRSTAEVVPHDGIAAEPVEVPLGDALDVGARALHGLGREACHRDAGRDHVRGVTVLADLEDQRWTQVLVPVWVASYRFFGRDHLVLVDGVGGEVHGTRAVHWWKVRAVTALFLAPGAALIVVGLPLLFVAVGAPVTMMGLFLLVIGAVPAAWAWMGALAAEVE